MAQEWGFIVFVISLSIACVVFNGIIVTVFVVYKSIRNHTNMFVLSLACADVIVGAISMPLWILESTKVLQFRYAYNDSIDVLCGSASIYNCALLSIERALKIRFPYWYTNNVNAFRIKVVIFFGWIAAILVGSLSLLRGMDTQNYYYLSFVSVFCYILPVLAIFISYTSVFLVAHKHAKSIRSQNRQIGNVMTRTTVSEAKTAWRLSVFIIVFIICWTPFYIRTWGFLFIKNGAAKTVFNIIANTLPYINAAINPFIYTIFNPLFRKGIVKLYKKGMNGHKTETSRRIETSTAQTNINNSPSLSRPVSTHCSPQIGRLDLSAHIRLLTPGHTGHRSIDDEDIHSAHNRYYETSL